MREFIKSFVEFNDNKLSRWFAFFIQALILVSLVTFSVETLPNLKPETRYLLRIIEIFCVVIFTVEYILRIYVADSKPRFIFSFFGLIDFAAVGIYYFENEAQPEHFSSIFDSLWWAIITLTTVGYGDVYPITVGGKVFTFIILMIGLGIVAVPTGIISSALTGSVDKKE